VKLPRPFWKARPEEEVDAEFAFHVEMRVRDLVARGVHPDIARRQAIERFGDFAFVSDTCKLIAHQRDDDMRRIEYLSELKQDVSFALRQLRTSPAFSIVAGLTLALGIGATTAIFSAVRAVVLRPFPYANPDRVMLVMERWKEQNGNVSVGNFTDLAAQQKSFDKLAAVGYSSFTISNGTDAPDRVFGARVTADYFSVYGVAPIEGRVFTPAQDQPGQSDVAMIGENVWRNRFGGARDIIGRTIYVNTRPFTVVGVMPKGFDPVLAQEEVWIPAAFTPAQKTTHDGHFLNVVALRKQGVSQQQVDSDLAAIARTLRERFPKDNGDRELAALSLPQFIVGNFRQRLFVMLGAVSLVLLIACGNVANLLLARGAARGQEVAVRMAIGAGQGRIVRQLLTESIVLALVGAAGGVAAAYATIKGLIHLAPAGIPRLNETTIDGTVLLFTLGAAMVSAIAFGLAPALRSGRQDLAVMMREGSRSLVAARDTFRGILVVAEVALALTLLVGTGLLVRTAINLGKVDPGYDPSGLIAARVALPFRGPGQPQDRTPEQVVTTFQRMVDQLGQTPGVKAAAITSQAPMGGGGNSNGMIPEGKAIDPKNAIDARLRMVSPGYLKVMGIPLVSGSDFTPGASRGTTLEMIVSEALAKKAWPGENPIGKRIRCCEPTESPGSLKTVVGVARDVRSNGPAADVKPEFYIPIAQAPADAWEWISRAMTVVVRANAGDPKALLPAIRNVVKSIEPTTPVYNATTMDESLSQVMAPAKFNTLLLATLGGLGLLLSAIGIYSVIAYFVSLRTHEIGLRMALGASGRDVMRMMTVQGMRPVLVGVLLGTLGSLWTTRLLQGSLYGVSATDPATFVVVVATLVTIALVATLLPARRATRIDPTRALQG
jgi:predicted permease